VQRILAYDSLYDEVKNKLVAKTKAQTLICGDPLQEDTFVNPMISEKEAIPLEPWVQNAISSKATLLCGT